MTMITPSAQLTLTKGNKSWVPGPPSRSTSMPSWTLFDQQPESYRNDVLPDQPQSTILRVSIEAGTTIGWERYTGINGLRYGIDVFGASAPANDLYAHFGLTAVGITNKVLAAIAGKSAR